MCDKEINQDQLNKALEFTNTNRMINPCKNCHMENSCSQSDCKDYQQYVEDLEYCKSIGIDELVPLIYEKSDLIRQEIELDNKMKKLDQKINQFKFINKGEN